MDLSPERQQRGIIPGTTETVSSSASDNTHFEKNDLESGGKHNGDADENNELEEGVAQQDTTPVTEKEKDPNIVGWDGM